MTFDEMTKIEPMLGDLKELAVEARYMRESEREQFWYRVLKQRMKKLVGWMAEKPALMSCECYDTAYKTLIKYLGV